MGSASLDLWLQRLETIHPRAMDLGLERVGAVAARLQLLPAPCPVVTVAGTNGKGSCIAVMESLLGRQGKKVGVSTSPHLQRFNERIRVAGNEVTDDEIVAAFEAIDRARGNITLTYFEFATLAALLIFRQHKVELLLLEVGLGGRLDAANIVDPSVALITSIALDHQEWLGDTRGAIAREKAGILRPGGAVVIADPDPPSELVDCVTGMGARALFLGRDFALRETGGTWSASLVASGGQRREVVGQEQGSLLPVNICAALQTLLVLGEAFSDEQLQDAVGGLQPGGRREVRQRAGRVYVLDVAHNPAAVAALDGFLQSQPCGGSTIALFSAMADKAIHDMIRACANRFDGWFLADQPQLPRAATGAEIAAAVTAEGGRVESVSSNVEAAYRRARGLMNAGDRLVVFGSFHTVAAVMQQMERDHGKQ